MSLTKKIQIIDRVGNEMEGAIDQSLIDTPLFHHDTSVNVVGRSELQDCDCSNSCACSECYRCSHSDERLDECRSYRCRVCQDCEETIESCVCFSADVDVDCPVCYSVSKENACPTACDEHREAGFRSNSMQNCEDFYMDCDGRCGCELIHVCDSEGKYVDGEIVSPPLDKSELEDWIRKYYPYKTNHSCGAHIHVSTIKMKYMSILMDKRFHAYLVRRLYRWGRNAGVRENSDLFKRLKGEVQWCLNRYDAVKQIHEMGRTADRYRIINYCYNIRSGDEDKQRKTMEIRVLPAFRMVDLTVKSQLEVINIVEKFVRDNIHSLKICNKTITMEVMV